MRATVCLLVLLSGAFGGEIIMLNDDFNEKTAKDTWFVEFFAPWCHNCAAMEPTWKRLAQVSETVHIAKVDCTRNIPLCMSWGIMAYPTLNLIANGKFLQFYGGRSFDALQAFSALETTNGLAIPHNPFRDHAVSEEHKGTELGEGDHTEDLPDADEHKDGADPHEGSAKEGEGAAVVGHANKATDDDGGTGDRDSAELEHGDGKDANGEAAGAVTGNANAGATNKTAGSAGDEGGVDANAGAGQHAAQNDAAARQHQGDAAQQQQQPGNSKEQHEQQQQQQQQAAAAAAARARPPRSRRDADGAADSEARQLRVQLRELEQQMRRMQDQHVVDMKHAEDVTAFKAEQEMQQAGSVSTFGTGFFIGVLAGAVCGFVAGRMMSVRTFKPIKQF